MNELKEKIARTISTTRGDDFDAIPADKREWIDCRGKVSGRFRDVNEPFKDDYIDMADAALRAIEEAGYVVVKREPAPTAAASTYSMIVRGAVGESRNHD